jgi:hypothetical protein
MPSKTPPLSHGRFGPVNGHRDDSATHRVMAAKGMNVSGNWSEREEHNQIFSKPFIFQ